MRHRDASSRITFIGGIVSLQPNVRNGWKADIERAAQPCDQCVMQSSPAVEAARHFLSLVWEGDRPTDAMLSEALDRLVMAYHSTPDADVSDSDLEAPRQDGASLYKELSERFPDFGLYPVADPSASIEEAMGMGDAIDDLADLTLDMREVVWLADQLTLDDAHWSFRLHFFHWGEHARELSLYLHARQW